MDAKTLHAFISEQGLFPAAESYRFAAEYEQAQKTILSALSLAAAVEGPEEATPGTDASLIDIDGKRYVPNGCAELLAVARTLERQRNAALRALKAERELLAEACHALRMNDDDLQCETANKINAALAAQEGRHE